MMVEVLLDGITVQYTGSGGSLSPFVESGYTCFLEPIRGQILRGDIVFAAVQPNDRHYCHLVWRVEEWENEYGVSRTVYIIGNNYKATNKHATAGATASTSSASSRRHSAVLG